MMTTFAPAEDLVIKSVRFFCPECGKEMWTGLDCVGKWDGARGYSLPSLKILLVCSDCLLEEIRADRAKKKTE